MEGVFSWLNQPLVQDGFVRIWMAIAVGAVIALAIILILVLVRKKRRKEDPDGKEPITEKPTPLPILELANLQGLGTREEQQDAFGVSRIERMEEEIVIVVMAGTRENFYDQLKRYMKN